MIAVLIYPGFQLLDAAGPIAAFEIACRLAARPVAIKVIATTPGAVRSSSGVELMAQGLRAARGVSTLLVAGGEGVQMALNCPRILAFLRGAASRGCRVASVCSGSFLLAEAGLLNERRATTHWGRTRDFRSRYPRVKLEPDSIFVRDGAIWSSAGISAGIDLALAIIAEDFGDAIAQQTARQLVVYHRRSGGQSQFSSLLELQSPAGRFGALLDWVRAHLHQRLTVEELAARVAMSPRHFARAFITEIGTTPAKAVERLRIEAARSMVQSSASSIECVAQATGFGDPERMRRAFIRAFGQPPQALRRASRATAYH